MTERIEQAVQVALARQLRLDVSSLVKRADEGLDRLGLDSFGLMRVLLDIEKSLDLKQPLELPDAALATPATLVAGVVAALG